MIIRCINGNYIEVAFDLKIFMSHCTLKAFTNWLSFREGSQSKMFTLLQIKFFWKKVDKVIMVLPLSWKIHISLNSTQKFGITF